MNHFFFFQCYFERKGNFGLRLAAVTAHGRRGAVLQQSSAARAGMIKQPAACLKGILYSPCCDNKGFFKIHYIICIHNPRDLLHWGHPSIWWRKKATPLVTASIRWELFPWVALLFILILSHVSPRLPQGANVKLVPKTTTLPILL